MISPLANMFLMLYITRVCFPAGSVVKNLPAITGHMGSIPESGRYPGEGNGNSLQYFCLKNSIDRGAWWAIIQEITTSQT